MNEKLELLINEVKKAVLGKDDVLKKVVIALMDIFYLKIFLGSGKLI